MRSEIPSKQSSNIVERTIETPFAVHILTILSRLIDFSHASNIAFDLLSLGCSKSTKAHLTHHLFVGNSYWVQIDLLPETWIKNKWTKYVLLGRALRFPSTISTVTISVLVSMTILNDIPNKPMIKGISLNSYQLRRTRSSALPRILVIWLWRIRRSTSALFTAFTFTNVPFARWSRPFALLLSISGRAGIFRRATSGHSGWFPKKTIRWGRERNRWQKIWNS